MRRLLMVLVLVLAVLAASLIGKACGVDTNSFADKYSTYSKEYLDQANTMDKADEEAAGSSAPASSRFTADMKGESKVDTTPSETFEDVKNESKDESKYVTIPSDLVYTEYYRDRHSTMCPEAKKYFASGHQAAVDAKCKKYDGKFLVTRTYLENGKKIESRFSSEAYVLTDKITTIIYIYDTYDEAKAAYETQLTANPMHTVEFRVK